MNRLNGKIAIITGGALGIGRACAIRLAEEGAGIAVFDVLDTPGEALVAELIGRGFRARYWNVDVSAEANVHTAIDAAVAHFGRRQISNSSMVTVKVTGPRITPAAPNTTRPPMIAMNAGTEWSFSLLPTSMG